ncbi:MAG TPA: SCO family protein [Burkholderiaceae bacterium]
MKRLLGQPGAIFELGGAMIERASWGRICAIGLMWASMQSHAAAHAVPEAELIDQDGKTVSFHRDLVQGKTAVVNFIFTSCTMICPTQTASLRQVQKDLGTRAGNDISFISISIDPNTDQPAKLKSFARQFEVGPGWEFLTGSRPVVDRLLRSLGAGVTGKNDHSGMVLIINEKKNVWLQLANLPDASLVLRSIEQVAGPDPALQAANGRYFPNVSLLTQDGQSVKFYDDVIKDKVVLINFMFTTCPGICSPMTANLAKVQGLLDPRVQMVSITVDPETDTPAVLKKFADQFKAQPGWLFLTGSKENIGAISRKLGGSGPDKDAHSSVLLAGNMQTGDWKKLFAVAPAEEIAVAVGKLLPPQ